MYPTLLNHSFSPLPAEPGTSILVTGALLLVLIILVGVFWIAWRRR